MDLNFCGGHCGGWGVTGIPIRNKGLSPVGIVANSPQLSHAIRGHLNRRQPPCQGIPSSQVVTSNDIKVQPFGPNLGCSEGRPNFWNSSENQWSLVLICMTNFCLFLLSSSPVSSPSVGCSLISFFTH